MTEPELKKLAEFAAEFFGAIIEESYGNGIDHWKFPLAWKNKQVGGAWPVFDTIINDTHWESCLFTDERIAPILAHLALKEMEKRGFAYYHQHYQLHAWSFSKSLAMPKEPLQDDNNFIALWSAIEQTGER